MDAESARWITITYFALLVLATCIFVVRRSPVFLTALAIFLLGIDPVLFHYSRIAIFEIPITAWVYLSLFLALSIDAGRPLSRIAVLIIAAVAGLFLLKAAVPLYLLPPIAALSMLALIQNVRTTSGRVGLALFVASSALLTGWLTYDVWIDRIVFPDLGGFTGRLFLNPLSELTPIALTAGFLAMFHGAVTDPGRFLRDPYRLALAAITIGVPLLLAVFSYAPPRYYVAVVPACLLLFVNWLSDGCWKWPPATRLGFWNIAAGVLTGTLAGFFALRALDYAVLARLPIDLGDTPGISGISMLNHLGWLMPVAALLVLLGRKTLVRPPAAAVSTIVLIIAFGATSVANIFASIGEPNYGSAEVRASLTRAVPPGASVAGDWAPFFALGTDIPSLYSNNQTNRVARWPELRPDFFLDSGTRFDASTLNSLSGHDTIKLGEPIPLGTHVNRAIRLWPVIYLDPGISGLRDSEQ